MTGGGVGVDACGLDPPPQPPRKRRGNNKKGIGAQPGLRLISSYCTYVAGAGGQNSGGALLAHGKNLGLRRPAASLAQIPSSRCRLLHSVSDLSVRGTMHKEPTYADEGMVAVALPGAVTSFHAKASQVSVQVARLVSVDVLRGTVMVLMALDHARDFLTYLRFAPEDMAHTYGALFLTRFVTHFCAPVFAFLAGTGAFLATSRGKSLSQVSHFFWTRGLWLVFLELTVVDFAWGFIPWAHGGVIWILGWSMVVMALIVRLPVRWIAVVGLGMIATHNLLDAINPASFGSLYWVWMLLHSPGRIPIGNFQFSVRYVLIPWVGVMAAGFAFGKLLLRPDRRKWILTLGICATALFFCLRGINLYGNGIAGLPYGYPRSAGPWSVQPSLSLTVISFFNTLKYPPSLAYLLMTLGPALTVLGLL